jgi:Domain of unknown function (DUF4383)
VATLVACVFGMLGILGALRTGLSDPFRERGTDLLGLTTHPITALIHLTIGLVGVPAAQTVEASGRFVVGVGVLLAAWSVAGVALDGSPNDLLVRDLPLAAVHAIGAATCLVAAARSRTA